jgi:glycosyltransferase involved in cell wall biosynthesis
MPNAPRFSILLPTHNRPEVLELAIKSVLQQKFEDFELLAVGDGCTDNTSKVVARFDDPRVLWFDLPKAKGFGYANRNIALKQTKGELIAFLGHDNLLFPDHLELMNAPFESEAVQFAYSRPLWIRDDGLIIPSFVNLRLPAPMKSFLQQNNVLPATCVVHRRSCFDSVGYWPEDIESSGDYLLWKRIINQFGPSALRFVRRSTCLHFRANWRKPEHWAPPPVAYLSAIFDSARFWPHPLHPRLSIEGELPQQQTWKQIADGRMDWVLSVRNAVQNAQDSVAWNAGLDSNFIA